MMILKSLLKAKEEMQGVKIKLKEEETDEICEKCGRNMVVKVGRFRFLLAPAIRNVKIQSRLFSGLRLSALNVAAT